MGFTIIESGNEEKPWCVWDVLDDMPWDHYETYLDAAEAIVKIEWQIRNAK